MGNNQIINSCKGIGFYRIRIVNFSNIGYSKRSRINPI
jgi:hypothetical protein